MTIGKESIKWELTWGDIIRIGKIKADWKIVFISQTVFLVLVLWDWCRHAAPGNLPDIPVRFLGLLVQRQGQQTLTGNDLLLKVNDSDLRMYIHTKVQWRTYGEGVLSGYGRYYPCPCPLRTCLLTNFVNIMQRKQLLLFSDMKGCSLKNQSVDILFETFTVFSISL